MNEYDSERIADLMVVSKDMVLTDSAENADVLFLNTCSVREKAQEKVFSQLGRWREWKTKRPKLVIGVGGCVASQEGEQILRRAPYVDVVFGPQTYHRLPAMLDAIEETQAPCVDTSFPEIEKFDELVPPHSKGPKAYVSVMEGCSKYCTFCVVPYTRGEEFSRPFDDVITEIYELAEQGVREVTLLGQNVNAYRGVRHRGEKMNFADLLSYVAAVPGVERLRYTTSHPVDFSDSLIEVYKYLPELVSHLHLPVQSGSDRILEAMKRKYTVDQFESIVDRIRDIRPELSLSSDFIVGFPDETDSDFDLTMKFIEKVKFVIAYSFMYSSRPGTPAQKKDNIDLKTKKARLTALQSLLKEQQIKYNNSFVNKNMEILFEKEGRYKNQYIGRTIYNQSAFINHSNNLINKIVNVKINRSTDFALECHI